MVDMKEIWLVTTDHLEKELWFRDDEDFKVGMNFVAIQAVCCPEVIVLAFILMSNHVHFVVVGTREEVEAFFGSPPKPGGRDRLLSEQGC